MSSGSPLPPIGNITTMVPSSGVGHRCSKSSRRSMPATSWPMRLNHWSPTVHSSGRRQAEESGAGKLYESSGSAAIANSATSATVIGYTMRLGSR